VISWIQISSEGLDPRNQAKDRNDMTTRVDMQPDSSGLPEGLLDQRFERWVSALGNHRGALQHAYYCRFIG
jgi:hypothetical protein